MRAPTKLGADSCLHCRQGLLLGLIERLEVVTAHVNYPKVVEFQRLSLDVGDLEALVDEVSNLSLREQRFFFFFFFFFIFL